MTKKEKIQTFIGIAVIFIFIIGIPSGLLFGKQIAGFTSKVFRLFFPKWTISTVIPADNDRFILIMEDELIRRKIQCVSISRNRIIWQTRTAYPSDLLINHLESSIRYSPYFAVFESRLYMRLYGKVKKKDLYKDTLLCMDIDTGSVIWCKNIPLSADLSILDFQYHTIFEKDFIYALSYPEEKNKIMIRAFNCADGSIIWEKSAEEQHSRTLAAAVKNYVIIQTRLNAYIADRISGDITTIAGMNSVKVIKDKIYFTKDYYSVYVMNFNDMILRRNNHYFPLDSFCSFSRNDYFINFRNSEVNAYNPEKNKTIWEISFDSWQFSDYMLDDAGWINQITGLINSHDEKYIPLVLFLSDDKNQKLTKIIIIDIDKGRIAAQSAAVKTNSNQLSQTDIYFTEGKYYICPDKGPFVIFNSKTGKFEHAYSIIKNHKNKKYSLTSGIKRYDHIIDRIKNGKLYLKEPLVADLNTGKIIYSKKKQYEINDDLNKFLAEWGLLQQHP